MTPKSNEPVEADAWMRKAAEEIQIIVNTALIQMGIAEVLDVNSESEAQKSGRKTIESIISAHAPQNHRALLEKAEAALKMAVGAFENNNCIDWNELEVVRAELEAALK